MNSIRERMNIFILLIVLIGVLSVFTYKIRYISSIFTFNSLNSSKSAVIPLDTSVPEDKWQSYKNEKYNFKIKYRPEFQLRELNDKSLVIIDNVIEDKLPDEKNWFVITIQIQPNDSELSPNKYLEMYARSYPNCRNKILDSFVDYKINEITGIKGNIDPCSNNPNISVLFTDNFYAYIIQLKSDLSFNPPFTDTKLKLFDRILSTFEFTE